MASQDCPTCNAELERSGELKRHCNECHSDFKIEITCRECGDVLQRLKACGAVSFWCEKCNEQKSKSTAVYTFIKQME